MKRLAQALLFVIAAVSFTIAGQVSASPGAFFGWQFWVGVFFSLLALYSQHRIAQGQSGREKLYREPTKTQHRGTNASVNATANFPAADSSWEPAPYPVAFDADQLDPSPQEVDDADRFQFDISTIVVTVIVCVTVLFPWLVGRFLLRGYFGREKSPEVYIDEARDGGMYFLSDWFAGICAILVISAILLLAWPQWRQRVWSIVAAFTFLAASFLWIGPNSIKQWESSEAAAITQLAVSELDSECHADAYASAIYPSKVREYRWTALVTGRGRGCDTIEVHRGRELMSSRKIDEINESSSVSLRLIDLGSPADSILLAVYNLETESYNGLGDEERWTGRSFILAFRLESLEPIWSKEINSKSVPGFTELQWDLGDPTVIVAGDSVLVFAKRENTDELTQLSYSIADGSRGVELRCPSGGAFDAIWEPERQTGGNAGPQQVECSGEGYFDIDPTTGHLSPSKDW